MGVEIERKFLVRGEAPLDRGDGVPIRQGYISRDEAIAVRVRRAGERAYLTIKGERSAIERAEFEYEIPVADAEAMLAELCTPPLIEKTRFRVRHGARTFEVDVFAGANDGLVLAEIELASPEEAVELPDWIGREVTDDPRYRNASLAAQPFDRAWLEDG